MPRRARALRLVRQHWPLLLPAILTLAVFHAWVQPGLILGADWVRRVPAELNTFFPWPPAWNGSQQLGETNEVYLFEFPLFALMGLLSRLHFSWHVIERILFLWPYLVLSVIAPYALAFRLTRSSYASAVAASMFTVNTWVIMAAERGAIPSLVAAAIMPLFFLVVLSFIDRATVRKGLALGLILTVLLVYDLRYVYVSVIFALILAAEQLFRDRSLHRIGRSLLPIGAAVGTVVAANLYWILPQFFERANNGSDYGTLNDYIYNSGFMTPQHALSNFAVFYHWVASDNPFLAANPDWWFFALPVAVFVALFFTWRRKWVWSFALGAFIAVLLDSGPSFPVDKINIWIFLHIPGMSLFRDVTKWMSLLEISYATIIAMGIARLIAWLRLRVSKRLMIAAALLPVAAVACYALMMGDAFNIMRFRVFITYHVRADVQSLEAYIQSRSNHDRTLVIPRDSEAMRAILPHPYIEAMQIENGAPNDGFRHFNVHMGDLYSIFAAPYAADLLRLMNVRYVVVPYDYDKIIYSPQIAATGDYDVIDFMESRPWLHLIKKIGRQYVFEVRDPLETRAFVAPAPFILNGSVAGLDALSGTPLVNPRLAAILPDQKLGNIQTRVPNYVAAGWSIDTQANGPAKADGIVSNAIALDRAAKHGDFSYVAAAASTATTSGAMFQVDPPILINTSSSVPGKGPVSLSVNTLDLREVSPILLRKDSFQDAPTQFDVDESNVGFFVNTTMSVQQAGVLRLDRARGLYRGRVNIDNPNPVSLSGRLVLTGLSTSIGTRAADARVALNGVNLVCTPGACSARVRLSAGNNVASIAVPAGAAHPKRTVTYGIHSSASLFDEQFIHQETRLPVRWLAKNLDIRLTQSPMLRFHWSGPTVHPKTNRYLVYVMRSIEDGHTITVFEHVAPMSPNVNGLSQWFEVILRDRFSRLLAIHHTDPAWLFANRLPAEPDGYGEYSLTAIGMTDVGTSRSAGTTDFVRWKPVSLVLHATPEQYEIGAIDAQRTSNVTYPTQLTINASGYRAVSDTSIEGVPRYTFLRSRAGARVIRLEEAFVSARYPDLDFDFYQDKNALVKVDIVDTLKRLVFSQTLQPAQHAAAFGAGSIIADNDGDVSWPLDRPHCLKNSCRTGAVVSSRGFWRHVSIDVSHVAKQWNHRYVMRLTLLPLDRSVSELRFALTGRGAQLALAKGYIPALSLDGKPVAYATTRPLPESLYTVRGGSAVLGNTPHTMRSYPTFPVRPVSIVVARGKPRTFTSSDVRDGSQNIDTEYSGTVDSKGGLLVFSEAYDADWRLAIVPHEFHPSGFALLDYLRAKQYLLPDNDHYRVDDTLNGWWIPKGRNHLFMIMSLDPVLQGCAIAWIVIFAAWVVCVLIASRREKAA